MSKKSKNKTYHIHGDVRASAYLGSVEAKSGKEAMAKAMKKWEISDCSVCHHCSDKVEDPEVVSITVEGEDFYQAESNDFRDEEIKRLRAENENLKKCLKKTVQRYLNAKSKKGKI